MRPPLANSRPGVSGGFQGWTLFDMVWWIAWAPFAGVYVARISRGRSIREFVTGVVLVPSLFSLFRFGVSGGLGFYGVLQTDLPHITRF